MRIYYLSGAQHGPGALPLSDRTVDGFQAKQPLNTLDYRPAMRALLTALDQWVRDGTPPPASRVPRVADGTAVSRESLQASFTRIPGSAWVTHLPQRLRMDFGAEPEGGADLPAAGGAGPIPSWSRPTTRTATTRPAFACPMSPCCSPRTRAGTRDTNRWAAAG